MGCTDTYTGKITMHIKINIYVFKVVSIIWGKSGVVAHTVIITLRKYRQIRSSRLSFTA